MTSKIETHMQVLENKDLVSEQKVSEHELNYTDHPCLIPAFTQDHFQIQSAKPNMI